MPIELQLVQSSNIRAVGYEPSTATLAVQFHTNGLYHYAGVPERVYVGLRSAPSKGRFFATQIRPYYRGVRQESQHVD